MDDAEATTDTINATSVMVVYNAEGDVCTCECAHEHQLQARKSKTIYYFESLNIVRVWTQDTCASCHALIDLDEPASMVTTCGCVYHKDCMAHIIQCNHIGCPVCNENVCTACINCSC